LLPAARTRWLHFFFLAWIKNAFPILHESTTICWKLGSPQALQIRAWVTTAPMLELLKLVTFYFFVYLNVHFANNHINLLIIFFFRFQFGQE
jgi:hypothetical protein